MLVGLPVDRDAAERGILNWHVFLQRRRAARTMPLGLATSYRGYQGPAAPFNLGKEAVSSIGGACEAGKRCRLVAVPTATKRHDLGRQDHPPSAAAAFWLSKKRLGPSTLAEAARAYGR